MYKINIVCVGKLKEAFYDASVNEYKKRLQKFCELNIIELNEEQLPSNPSKAQIEKALDLEYQKILPNLKGNVVVCDLNGKQFTSEGFSDFVFKNFDTADTLTFVIGSSYGLSNKIKSNKLVSFSLLTFPHHLMRVFVLEQIYRAFCIKNNITYHK